MHRCCHLNKRGGERLCCCFACRFKSFTEHVAAFSCVRRADRACMGTLASGLEPHNCNGQSVLGRQSHHLVRRSQSIHECGQLPFRFQSSCLVLQHGLVVPAPSKNISCKEQNPALASCSCVPGIDISASATRQPQAERRTCRRPQTRPLRHPQALMLMELRLRWLVLLILILLENLRELLQ